MTDKERADRRTKKVYFEAAVLMAVPITIVLAFGLLVGGYFLKREIQNRESDRAAILAEAARNNQQAIRKLICIAERNSLSSKQRTDAEKQAIIAGYNKILADLKLAPCALPKEPG